MLLLQLICLWEELNLMAAAGMLILNDLLIDTWIVNALKQQHDVLHFKGCLFLNA